MSSESQRPREDSPIGIWRKQPYFQLEADTMADSIAAHSRILSAVSEAKADTKDGADGLSKDKEVLSET